MGILEVLIPLTASDSVEVQGNSAAAIGNLSAKADDYTKFMEVWLQPEGGLHGYLVRFLESQDRTFQHIAVWTIVQFLEGGDSKLAQSVKASSQILPFVNKLITVNPSLSNDRDGGGGPDHGGDGKTGGTEVQESNSKATERQTGEVKIPEGNEVKPSDSVSQNGSIGSDEDEFGENGEAEIPQLARRILEMI